MLSDSPEKIALLRTTKAAEMFLDAIGTERALRVKEQLLAEDYLGVATNSIAPSDYLSSGHFCLDYAAVSFLKKLEGMPTGLDLDEIALRAFKGAETMCASTNIRFTYGRPLKNGAEQLIESARRKIASIIGEKPDYDRIASLMTWGPGATATIKGDMVRPESKVLEPKLSVTPKAFRLARGVVGRDLHWMRARLGCNHEPPALLEVAGPCSALQSEFQLVHYMRVVTVPKSSVTRRTIGAEPSMNGYIQQGVGRLLKDLLFKKGVNLRDQSWNQTLAKCAQQLNLCTIDLSSASDTLSYWLVEELLPPAWFELLSSLRSGHALMPDGKIVALEKFSSMGNAFTFELESLIFYALSWACCQEVGAPVEFLSVFGDDIIVDRRAYSRIEGLFKICGFKVNPEKSYVSGRFFESCGVHAFNGCDVTPMYQKELLYGLPELVRLHNRILRWCERTVISRNRFDRLLSFLRREAREQTLITGEELPRVPHGTEGDLGFWTHGMKVTWSDGMVLCYTLEAIPNSSPSIDDSALLAISLQKGANRSPVLPCYANHVAYDGHVSLRGDPVYRVRRRWIPHNAMPIRQEGWERKEPSNPQRKRWYNIPQLRCTAYLN